MKRLPQLLLLAFPIIIIYVIACQREISQNSNAFDASAAKEWYYGVFKKSSEWVRSPLKGRKLPDWKKGISKKVGDVEVVEFPLISAGTSVSVPENFGSTETDRKRIAEASLSRIAFIKNKRNEIVVKEIQFVPDYNYLSTNNFDISKNTIINVENNFSGIIAVKRWDGKPIISNFLNKGKVVARVGSVKMTPTANQRITCTGILVTEYERVCDIHITGSQGDLIVTVECTPWVPTGYSWCFEDPETPAECTNPTDPQCYCQLIGNCEEPDPNNPEPLPPLFKNDVDDPCLHAMVDYAISADCRNKIATFINNVYQNNEVNHLIFSDENFQPPHSGEDAYTKTTSILGFSEIKTNIQLNNSQLGSATREYIAATILHESIHAWIDYQFPVSTTNTEQHELMASTARFNMMRDALMEMFPNLSPQHATDLTWGGLGGTIAYLNLSSADRTRIEQTNQNYKHHLNNTGTRC